MHPQTPRFPFWRKMIPISKVATVLVAIAAGFASSQADENSTLHPGKSVALVLGGGGALGFAHLGMIKWLEEHRIPVDYIAGNSAGAVLGGWYAAGGRPADLEQTLGTLQWDEIASGDVAYRDLAVRRKQERSLYPGTLQLEMAPGFDGAKTRGFAPRHQLGLVFDGATSAFPLNSLYPPSGPAKGYDGLALPFRAVAADVTGEYSVTRQVNLGDPATSDARLKVWPGLAMRASSAVPYVFTAMRRSDLTLADGQLVDNVPVDLGIAFDPYTIITMDLDVSSVDFLGIHVPVVQNTYDSDPTWGIGANPRRQLKVLLNTTFTPADYVHWKEIEKDGYDTMEHLDASTRDAILSLHLSPADWSQYMAAKQARVPQPLRIQSVAFDAPTPSRWKGPIERAVVGEALDNGAKARLNAVLNEMVGTERFDWAGFYVLDNGGGNGQLVVHAEPKSYGPTYQRRQLVVNVGSDRHPAFSYTNRLTGLTSADSGSEINADLSFGTGIDAQLGLLARPSGSRFFLMPRAFYSDQTIDVPAAVRRVGGGIEAGYEPNSRQEFRLGFAGGQQRSPDGGGEGPFLDAHARWTLDSLDHPVVPRQGLRFDLGARWVFESPGAERQFPQATFDSAIYQPIGGMGAAFLVASGGTSFGYPTPLADQFLAGRSAAIGALSESSIAGDEFGFASLGYRHKLLDAPLFIGSVYASVNYDFAAVRQLGSGWQHEDGAGVELLFDSKLGPFRIGVGFPRHSKSVFQFSLGVARR